MHPSYVYKVQADVQKMLSRPRGLPQKVQNEKRARTLKDNRIIKRLQAEDEFLVIASKGRFGETNGQKRGRAENERIRHREYYRGIAKYKRDGEQGIWQLYWKFKNVIRGPLQGENKQNLHRNQGQISANLIDAQPNRETGNPEDFSPKWPIIPFFLPKSQVRRVDPRKENKKVWFLS